ncbi:MAG: TlpA family protein disulfide reductase [Holophagales bacterium]|nr:TlpA family protein disulfide reductase [Holophagales bacterium]MYG31683.1 TlpA family protein disulfide reductase [Holophagales bacterium]MYI79525.1 TlpA family protein disulfide reductase [Holophagales bacterium]
MNRSVSKEPGATRVRTALAVLGILFLTASCDHATVSEPPGTEDPWTTASRDTDADWQIVQAYIDQTEATDIFRSAAAARAILGEGGRHEKTIEAATFLVNLTSFDRTTALLPGIDQQVVAGAKALFAHAPNHEAWRRVLFEIGSFNQYAGSNGPTPPATDSFLQEMVSETDDPRLRAAARYYLATGVMRSANVLELTPEDREGRRRRALGLASGLKAGVEQEEFLVPGFRITEAKRTFAHAEADLVRRIHHATVGGTLPDLTGTRLDGSEESLADYQGRVLLLDFWATWCAPCLAALPDLRELVNRLPADHFALLAISVDVDRDSVTEFFTWNVVSELLDKEPVPWANWHVGEQSALEWQLEIDRFPTYVLADERGKILARTSELSDEFLTLIERAVANSTTS